MDFAFWGSCIGKGDPPAACAAGLLTSWYHDISIQDHRGKYYHGLNRVQPFYRFSLWTIDFNWWKYRFEHITEPVSLWASEKITEYTKRLLVVIRVSAHWTELLNHMPHTHLLLHGDIRRNGPLRGPTSSPCPYYAVMAHFSPFLVSSSNLGNFQY